MKILITFVLAAGLALGGAAGAGAIDIKASGQFDFVGQWGQKGGNKAEPLSYDSGTNHSFYQRGRIQLDLIASESLCGVLGFEIGEITWGRSGSNVGPSTGGGLGTGGTNLEVRHAYLDWTPPRTDLKVRMGLQSFANPSFVYDSSQIFDDQAAGVSANYPFTEHAGLTAWWFRPLSGNSPVYTESNGNPTARRKFNDMDMFGLALPHTFPTVKVIPWGMYASIGRDSITGYDGATSINQLKALFPSWVDPDPVHSSKGRGNAWWVGLTGEITTADPFRFAWDFNYGSVNMGRAVQRNDDGTSTDRDGNIKRAGWYAALLAEYKLDCATPGLAGWYGSGDGKNWKKGSHMLPMIAASSKLTSFGQDGADFDMPCTGLQTGLAGTWGLVAQVKDVSLLEDLSHTLRAAYYRGTNHTNNAGRRGGPMQSPWANTDADTAYLYMTTRDTAWEFNCDTSYTIYENLSAGLELGYIKLNINESIWGKDNKKQSRNMYKIAVGMTYSF